jgi:putative endonuclease
MSFYVYVLGCSDRDGTRTYVGWTTEPERRLAEHNAGTGARSTRGRTWVLLHLEQLATKREAMSREWHLKRDRRRRRALAGLMHAPQHQEDLQPPLLNRAI